MKKTFLIIISMLFLLSFANVSFAADEFGAEGEENIENMFTTGM